MSRPHESGTAPGRQSQRRSPQAPPPAKATEAVTSINREALEAVLWHAFPAAAVAQIDAILDAADAYADELAAAVAAHCRRAPGNVDGPTARLLAAEHRRVLEEALREDGR
jgi:hypothetical protein